MKYLIALSSLIVCVSWANVRGEEASLVEWAITSLTGIVIFFVLLRKLNRLDEVEEALAEYQDNDFALTDQWTLKKEEFIEASVESGHDMSRMAETLGHSETSVRGKLVSMKLYHKYLEIQVDRGPEAFERWQKLAKRIGKVIPINTTIADSVRELETEEKIDAQIDWEYAAALISQRNDPRIELCQSFNRNLKSRLPDPITRHELVKHVAAFLNTAGGQILIGVSKSGYVTGLFDDDFQTERHYRDQITKEVKSALGREALICITVEFIRWGSEDICMVTCKRSSQKVLCCHKKYNERIDRPANDLIYYLRVDGSSEEGKVDQEQSISS